MFTTIKKQYQPQAGFTLIEMLVVITVIAIIASLVVSAVFQARIESRDMSRQTDLEQLKLAAKLHKEAHGEYPEYPEGIEIGVGLAIDDELGPFLGQMHGDPLSEAGGGGEYGYVYDSSYQCSGQNKIVILVRAVEKEKFANYESVCGTAAGEETFARVILVN